jgi:hypothetical protein
MGLDSNFRVSVKRRSADAARRRQQQKMPKAMKQKLFGASTAAFFCKHCFRGPKYKHGHDKRCPQSRFYAAPPQKVPIFVPFSEIQRSAQVTTITDGRPTTSRRSRRNDKVATSHEKAYVPLLPAPTQQQQTHKSMPIQPFLAFPQFFEQHCQQQALPGWQQVGNIATTTNQQNVPLASVPLQQQQMQHIPPQQTVEISQFFGQQQQQASSLLPPWQRDGCCCHLKWRCDQQSTAGPKMHDCWCTKHASMSY